MEVGAGAAIGAGVEVLENIALQENEPTNAMAALTLATPNNGDNVQNRLWNNNNVQKSIRIYIINN